VRDKIIKTIKKEYICDEPGMANRRPREHDSTKSQNDPFYGIMVADQKIIQNKEQREGHPVRYSDSSYPVDSIKYTLPVL